MANIKSAKKRIKVAKRNELKNKSIKSKIKTLVKNTLSLISSKKEEATNLLKKALKSIDKAVSKGVLHKNTAARKKSRLLKKFNKSLVKTN